MARREFTKPVAVAITKRATDPRGRLRCELCHGAIVKGEVHHVKQDAMETEKARKLTAADGLYLCKPCHLVETKKQAPVMAKVKRQEAKNLGVRAEPTMQSRPAKEKAPSRHPLPPRRSIYGAAT